jgi:guanylate kinase
VVNDDFATALKEIETIVLAKRLSLQSQAIRHQDLLVDLLR